MGLLLLHFQPLCFSIISQTGLLAPFPAPRESLGLSVGGLQASWGFRGNHDCGSTLLLLASTTGLQQHFGIKPLLPCLANAASVARSISHSAMDAHSRYAE